MSTRAGGDLLVVGAGGFGRETVDAVRAMNACGASWRLLGYLDDDPSLAGSPVNGVPVLGGEREPAGACARVGMGAVVPAAVPAREVWAEVPARRLRTADVGQIAFSGA